MTNTRTLAKEAALKLLQGGQRPTADRVRAAIGQGAQQTILGALDEFWVEIGERLRDPRLPEPLVAPVLELWGRAVTAADQRWQTERAALEGRLGELETRLADQNQRLARECQEKIDAEARALAADDRARALQQTTEDQQRAYAALTEEAGRLRTEAAQLRELLQIERDARERDQAVWLQQIDAARQTTKAAQAEKDQVGRLLEESRDRVVRQTLLLQQTEQRLQECDAVLVTRTGERDEARTRSDGLARQIERLDGDLRRRQVAAEEQDELIRQAAARNAGLADRVNAIQLEKEGLMAENRVLRDELLTLRANRTEFETSLQRALERLGDPAIPPE